MSPKRVKGLGLLLTFVGVIWALPASVPVLGDVAILANAGGYRRADFVVERVAFHPRNTQLAANFDGIGRIDGRTERVGLGGFIGISPSALSMFSATPKFPETQAEADAHAPAGTVLDVLYNPDASELEFGGRILRVLPYDPDFPSSIQSDLFVRDLPLWLGPLAVGILVWALGARAARRGFR